MIFGYTPIPNLNFSLIQKPRVSNDYFAITSFFDILSNLAWHFTGAIEGSNTSRWTEKEPVILPKGTKTGVLEEATESVIVKILNVNSLIYRFIIYKQENS